MGLWELSRQLLPFSLSSTMIPFRHDEEFAVLFCDRLQWMSKPQYYEISDIANHMPG